MYMYETYVREVYRRELIFPMFQVSTRYFSHSQGKNKANWDLFGGSHYKLSLALRIAGASSWKFGVDIKFLPKWTKEHLSSTDTAEQWLDTTRYICIPQTSELTHLSSWRWVSQYSKEQCHTHILVVLDAATDLQCKTHTHPDSSSCSRQRGCYQNIMVLPTQPPLPPLKLFDHHSQ